MGEDLKPIAIRAVRIVLALIAAGMTLGPMVWMLDREFHLSEIKPRQAALVTPRPAPGAKLERKLTFQVTDGSIRAHQQLDVRRDAGLCAAIQLSLVRSDDMSWVIGKIGIDQEDMPGFKTPALTVTGEGDCVLRTSSEEMRLFPGQDALPTASDRVRFQMIELSATDLLVVFHTAGIRVDGITKASYGTDHGGIAFRWSSRSMPGTVEFHLTRGDPLRLVDVVTRVDQNWLPFVRPPITAILFALPYALFIFAGRRHATARRWPLVEMAAWMLTLYLFLSLTWVAKGALDWTKRPFLQIIVALACFVFPFLIDRWSRTGRTSWIAEVGPLVPRTSIVALAFFAVWLGTQMYSERAIPRHWWYVVAEARGILAALAFAAACFWLIREIGGSIVHASALFVGAPALFFGSADYERLAVITLGALFLWALLVSLRAGFTQTRRVSFAAELLLGLLAAVLAHLLIPTRTVPIADLVKAANAAVLLALLAAFMILLYDHSRAGAPSGDAVDAGFAFALAIFFNYRNGLYAAVAVGSAYLLLRYWLFISEETRVRLQRTDPAIIRQGIHNLIAKHEAERALDGLRKTMRTKVESNEAHWVDYETATAEIEAAIDKYDSDGATNQASERALASGPQKAPWERGRYAALRAAALAIPWCVVYASYYSNDLVPAVTPFWLEIIAVFALGLAQWPLLGFFFGYFYPDIRGQNGLEKGLVFFFTIAVPPLLAHLIFIGELPPQLFLLWIFQNFIQAMVLGLVAGDYRTLRDYGLRWRHLRDVHNFGVLAAYGTSVIAAVAAAIATALASGIGGAFSKLIFP